jgi:lactate racemase
MANIELRYGDSHFYFEYDEGRFEVISPRELPPLSDREIGERLDDPIGMPPLEELLAPGGRVLIAVPDATREVACGQVVNLLIRRLIAAGVEPHDVNIIFATGIHRAVRPEEKQQILTPFIAQRIKTLDHQPRDIVRIVRMGETAGGIPVELNRALTEYDHVFLIGGIAFHYFAGFTGGRKLICPGLASSRTISATHKLAFDCGTMSRRAGVGPGLTDGNPVHEAFVEAASRIKGAFCINTIVNSAGELADLYCGDMVASHRVACEHYRADHRIEVRGKRELVIASCGGSPHDVNLIQAHKSLDAAARSCKDGGTIVLLAQCREGLGRDDFLKWFDAADGRDLAGRLCEQYQVNGQTAWSLMTKAERFDVRIVTDIHPPKIERMRMRPFPSLSAALDGVSAAANGYLVPFGYRTLPTLSDDEHQP